MTEEGLKEKLLADGVFRADGGLNTAWIKNRAKNYNFSNLEGDTLQEKLYILFRGRGYCCICGKPTTFKNWSYGYTKTCSRECKKELDSNTLRKCQETLYTEETKKKREETNLRKYGVKNVFQSSEVKEKSKNTSLEKYGVDHPMKTEETVEKIKRTCLEKYNKEFYTQTQEYKEKYKKTCLDKYGHETYFGSNEHLEKTEKFWMDKLGVNSNLSDEGIKERIRNTNRELYGVDYPMQNTSIRKRALSSNERSTPEKRMFEFLSNRGFDFEEQYILNDKCFDFAVFKNKELSILMEIDGEYFHGILEDPNDKHVKGFTDCERFSKVPEGVKLIVLDSSNLEKAFDEILRVFDVSYEDWIKEILDSLPKDFPYYNYSLERMKKDYKHLCEWEDIKPRGRLCDSIINNYHKSIYSSRVGEKPSPIEAWSNKELLEKCVRNRFIYSSSLSSHSVLQGFNVCKIAPKVSVFSSSLAKYLIRKYLNDCETIFDPFSGFSGRMLGTTACGKKYIGQDVNEEHIKESLEISNVFNLNTELNVKDVFDSSGSYDCLFACPPYNLKEDWNNTNQKNLSCDEWIDACLENFKCNKYLFVIDETSKYKDYIVEELTNTSHLNSNKEYVVLIKKPLQ